MNQASTQLLDGAWQFLPLPEAGAPAAPPTRGYADQPIQVPGYWNSFPASIGGDWGAYDHFRYPADWQQAPAGWYRRVFRTQRAPAGTSDRVRLVFDAVAGHSRVWLNGEYLGENLDSFLPFEFDVSRLLRSDGDNELAVHVAAPPQRDGLWLQPCGSWAGWQLRGIWQSVRLAREPACAIADVFAQPQLSPQAIAVSVTLGGDIPADAAVGVEIVDGDAVVLDLGRTAMQASPTITCRAAFPAAQLWSPEAPHLYHARATLYVQGEARHVRSVRFGMRELRIVGTQLHLNGTPVQLFGDSWHYMGAAQQNPAYVRAWFAFARATGINAIRTHAMPYPPCYFDLADELGMLIIDESAIYGSAGTLAYDEPVFWERCRAHVQRMVRRDRNHPSIVFWSVCNETIWKGGERIFPHLRALAADAQQLDPTRFASFDENDSDVGGTAPLHVGHYGTAQHWDRSWRRDRPLAIHEFGALYHGGPDDVCVHGGDAVYADYATRLAATGDESAEMFCKLRSLGAASITPWNMNWYTLEPRPATAMEHIPAELTAGGPALARIGPRALTLNYGYEPHAPAWKPNPAYTPLAACYQRRRFYLRQRPWQGFAGQTLTLPVEVWNDTPVAWRGLLRATLTRAARPAAGVERTVTLDAYGKLELGLPLTLPATTGDATSLQVQLTLTDPATGDVAFEEAWPLRLWPADDLGEPRARTIYTWGAATAPNAWSAALAATPVDAAGLAAVLADARATLVLADSAPTETLQDWLTRADVTRWLAAGGRLVVFADAVADADATALAAMPRVATQTHLEAGGDAWCAGLSAADLRDWGPDGAVTTHVFERPETGPAQSLLAVGDPAVGLAYSPLVRVPQGRGAVVLVGLTLRERWTDTPAARVLLQRLVHAALPASDVHAVEWIAPQTPPLFAEVGLTPTQAGDVLVCDGTDATVLDDPRTTADALAARFSTGGTLWLDQLVPATIATWAERLGMGLELAEDECYNVARVGTDPLLNGLNNFDFCWVQREEKSPIVRHTLDLTAPEVEPLVATVATRWEDYQTAHEQHKAALMYRRIEAFGEPRGAFVRIRRGRGQVIISQLLLREARGRFAGRARRILSRWLDALGVARAATVHPLRPAAAGAVRPDGFIREWLALGPFTTTQAHPLDAAYVDEHTLHPAPGGAAGGRTWQQVTTGLPHLDLTRVFDAVPDRDRVAYLALYVHSPQDLSALLEVPDMPGLRVGADGGTKILLNGHVVGRFDFVREMVPDADRVESIPLRRGWNTVVIKVHNPSGVWRCAARFLRPTGVPAWELRISTTPPADDQTREIT